MRCEIGKKSRSSTRCNLVNYRPIIVALINCLRRFVRNYLLFVPTTLGYRVQLGALFQSSGSQEVQLARTRPGVVGRGRTMNDRRRASDLTVGRPNCGAGSRGPADTHCGTGGCCGAVPVTGVEGGLETGPRENLPPSLPPPLQVPVVRGSLSAVVSRLH
ncbi:hypothetical protein J6590_035403 [Homalodisca vitripennis]|nr:hypothetical protein J6590_035403 [Homalodisca vitripennis]